MGLTSIDKILGIGNRLEGPVHISIKGTPSECFDSSRSCVTVPVPPHGLSLEDVK